MPSSGFIWFSLVMALLFAVGPLPVFMESGRPLWVMLVLSYWVIYLPKEVGLFMAWTFGIAQDVLYGAVLGEHALVFSVTVFFLLAIQPRMRLFSMWQQSLALLIIYSTVLLLQLWLNALIGHRPPTLKFLLPALVSSLLWPWISLMLDSLSKRYLR